MKYHLMRSLFLLLLTVGTALLWAGEDADVLRARLNMERVRTLAESGAIPRAELERAEDAYGDAQDLAVLRGAMSSRDLTEEQSDAMVAAAERLDGRRRKQLDKMRGLVDAGVAARNELQPFEEQAGFARNQLELARTRARLCHELGEMARAEQMRQWRPQQGARGAKDAVRFDGNGVFTPEQFQRVAAAFEGRFGKALPVSAMGETAVHRALGFDHRGRVDVALDPDAPEGVWLRRYLEARRIPYFAFWHAAAGKATGAHIHMGPESTRLGAAAD